MHSSRAGSGMRGKLGVHGEDMSIMKNAFCYGFWVLVFDISKTPVIDVI